MSVDLTQDACPIVSAIDGAMERDHGEGERQYLGASIIGDPCERKLWYAFRWACDPEHFSGRMLRLFRNGHRKEAEAVEDLRAAGMVVEDLDPETGEQFGFKSVGGHFAGHSDGKVSGVPGAEKTVHQFENKTHNAKSFAEVVKHGVTVAKPLHDAQMKIYADKFGLSRTLYLARNKDDDAYYAERGKADPAQAARLEAKAERIIVAHEAPPKVSDKPDSWLCRFCSKKGVCHDGDWARRNCRTCIHSTPEMDGDALWSCARHKVTLDLETQRAGCPDHLYLPSLVPGEPTDADEAANTVTYRLPDGSTWIDGAAEVRS